MLRLKAMDHAEGEYRKTKVNMLILKKSINFKTDI